MTIRPYSGERQNVKPKRTRKYILDKPAPTESLNYFVIVNNATKLYYSYTIPHTELHYFDTRRKAAVFSKHEYAIAQAIKCRGRRWEKFYTIMRLKCVPQVPKELHEQRKRWSDRITSEEVA